MTESKMSLVISMMAVLFLAVAWAGTPTTP